MKGAAIWCMIFGIMFQGCCGLEGSIGKFSGRSVMPLVKVRSDALIRIFPYDYFTAYTWALDLLKSKGAVMFAGSIQKHMIAVYVSEDNTTPVAVFFKEIAQDKTQIEVASPSEYAKESIGRSIFVSLEEYDAAEQK